MGASQVNQCTRSCLDSISASLYSFSYKIPIMQLTSFYSLKAAVEVEVLRSKNISCVLSIRRGNLICATRKAYQKAQISHIYIDKLDQPQEDLVSMFEPVCDMIEGRLTKDKAVLVHCTLGRSRSATVVIAYGMLIAHLSSSIRTCRWLMRTDYSNATYEHELR